MSSKLPLPSWLWPTLKSPRRLCLHCRLKASGTGLNLLRLWGRLSPPSLSTIPTSSRWSKSVSTKRSNCLRILRTGWTRLSRNMPLGGSRFSCQKWRMIPFTRLHWTSWRRTTLILWKAWLYLGKMTAPVWCSRSFTRPKQQRNHHQSHLSFSCNQ